MANLKPGGNWYLLATSSFLTSLYGLYFLSGRTIGDPAENKRILSLVASVGHIAFSTLTVAAGPTQFLAIVRTKWPLVHVWLGRVYSLGVIGGGIFALKASFTVNTLPQGHYYFLLLTVCWLYTIGQGLRTIWRKDVAAHQRWMARNYILTWSAFTIRGLIVFWSSMGFNDKEALTLASLPSWVPMSIAAELWWRYNDKKKAVA